MTDKTRPVPSPVNDNSKEPVPDNNPYFTVEQAADRLKLKPDTLDKWRQQGRGPIFREHGRRIVYHIDDLDNWSDDQKRQTARKYNRAADVSGDDGDAL